VELAAGDDGTPDDRTLLRLVRAGDDSAFGALFARHAAAVRGYALRCCADVADAEDMAAEAFFRVLQAVRRGSGPADNVRGYLFTVVRRLAAEWSVRRRDVPVADEELGRQVDAARPAPPPGVDLQLIAAAFTTLPRRWRAVLWRVEVEGERPAVAASQFGLSANATAALARRARQGLRAAYLQAHLAPAGGASECRTVVAKLGGFTAGQVTGAEAARIRGHLAGCLSCQALHAELRDVCDGLRRHAGALAPLAGGALGGRQLVLGKLLGRIGHVLAVGARAKFAVAALSVVAVGGAGFAAGPLIARLDAAPTVNRGFAVGPVLLSTTRSARPDPSRTGGPGRIAGEFDPARSRHHVRTTRTARPATGGVAPVAGTSADAPATSGVPVPRSAVPTNPVIVPLTTTTAPTAGVDLFASPAPTPTSPESTRPEPTSSDPGAPVAGTMSGTLSSGTLSSGTPSSGTPSSGTATTVWVWVWSGHR
jgi:RNA polymerase sigma factor (sigma-70 family)